MDSRTKAGGGGVGIDLMTGVGLMVTPHAWLWLPFALGAGLTIWGFWPLLANLQRVSHLWPFGRVPIHEAALEAYEAAERADALDYMVADGAQPQFKLQTFKYVFLVDDAAILFGIKPPSTKALPIPREIARHLYPDENGSQLDELGSRRSVAYTDVTISRKDLRRIKKQWPVEAKRWAAQFRNR